MSDKQVLIPLLSHIYEYVKSYFTYKEQTDIPIHNDDSTHISEIGSVIYENIIPTPLDVPLRELEMSCRQEIFEFLVKNKEYKSIRFIIPKYYSIYLLCHLLFDILDILSNELFHLQTSIVFCFDPQQKLFFIDELKIYIKNNIPFIQKNRILPIYIKFINNPPYHIEYTVNFEQRFHILFLKESEDDLSIQRLHFSIDI